MDRRLHDVPGRGSVGGPRGRGLGRAVAAAVAGVAVAVGSAGCLPQTREERRLHERFAVSAVTATRLEEMIGYVAGHGADPGGRLGAGDVRSWKERVSGFREAGAAAEEAVQKAEGSIGLLVGRTTPATLPHIPPGASEREVQQHLRREGIVQDTPAPFLSTDQFDAASIPDLEKAAEQQGDRVSAAAGTAIRWVGAVDSSALPVPSEDGRRGIIGSLERLQQARWYLSSGDSYAARDTSVSLASTQRGTGARRGSSPATPVRQAPARPTRGRHGGYRTRSA